MALPSPEQMTAVDDTSDAGLRREIIGRFKLAEANFKDWIKEAKEDYEFAMGGQWTQEELQTLKDQGRPAMSYNRIRPLINIISGYQRENSSRIKVSPEGGDDRIFSEFCDKILHFVDKVSHLTFKLGYQFDDGCYAGKSFLEAILDYENDPVRGELRFNLTTPYQIYADPEGREYDMNEGANYLFKVGKFTKGKLQELFPEKEKLIDGFKTDTDDWMENGAGILQEGGDDDYGNRPDKTTVVKESDFRDNPDLPQDMKFTLKEYWRYKRVNKYFVVEKETGEPRKFDDKDEAEQFALVQGEGIKVLTRKIREMWVADMCCGHILQDMISPFEPYYGGFPFFRYMVDWAPNAEVEKFRVQGLVRPLKDPQKEKNKAKSQSLHILNTQANSGWIGDEDALTPTGWDDLKLMGAKPGLVIKKKKGSELREILPKGPNQGHLIREEKADDEFNKIIGVDPVIWGMMQGDPSGKAVSLRVKQAIMALTRMFANYKYTKEIIGNFVLDMIPMLFDEKKALKVVGPQFMQINKISEGTCAGYLTLIKDNKYEVIVAEADENMTLRYETFLQLSDLLKAGAPVPLDLIIDYMDIPNSEEVKQKVLTEQKNRQMLAATTGKKK